MSERETFWKFYVHNFDFHNRKRWDINVINKQMLHSRKYLYVVGRAEKMQSFITYQDWNDSLQLHAFSRLPSNSSLFNRHQCQNIPALRSSSFALASPRCPSQASSSVLFITVGNFCTRMITHKITERVCLYWEYAGRYPAMTYHLN